jgi:hypothetical protein
MKKTGWRQLLQGWPWCGGPGSYPIHAYSEFLPPPRLGRRPYGESDPSLFEPDDPWGWYVSEYEELLELRPGLEHVANSLLKAIKNLAAGRPAPGLYRIKHPGNPCWPDDLAQASSSLRHERHVLLLPLALSRSQDDKGRVRWTVFGCSEQGPARGFWRGFFTAPDQEWPEEDSLAFIRRLLASAYGEKLKDLADLHSAGFRVLPQEDNPDDPCWSDGPLPSWVKPFLLGPKQSLDGVRWLLTFRPFGHLPESVRKAYLAGDLHLLPSPFSLGFWAVEEYRKLQNELPLARQVPLLMPLGRNEAWPGMRVPQAGWMNDKQTTRRDPAHPQAAIRNTYRRSHRFERMLRTQDPLALGDKESHLAHVLFSTDPEELGLYGKPMACNTQLWCRDYTGVLDGPRASREDLEGALRALHEQGHLGYRFQFPAMQVGLHEVYWHRPLVAYSPSRSGAAVLFDTPLGYLTAYTSETRGVLPRPAVELWPRLRQREPHLAAVELFRDQRQNHPYHSICNLRKLLETHELLGSKPLPHSFARQLLAIPKRENLERWLSRLPEQSNDGSRADALVQVLLDTLAPDQSAVPEPLTYHRTARRSFEVSYWKTIAELAEGPYRNKSNADCVLDPITQKHLAHHQRDLDPLGDHLLEEYTRIVKKAGMEEQALVGELPFRWETEFPYVWMGGWRDNQVGTRHERDLMVVIPGKDRSRAVIFADHYDTAYMVDRYDPEYGGCGARLAAHGADDNHSATATLLLAAPIYLELSKAGELGCDVWLIHLTGEEFPADCLGARHLTRCLVEGTLQVRLCDGSRRDLSQTRVQGVFVMDMISHNNDHDRDVFQIAPGKGPGSIWLAYQAHLANEVWNHAVPDWNLRHGRKGAKRPRRRADGKRIPGLFPHLALQGQVRPYYDPRSTLYNTDGQIFSDAGVPVVLFMEDYDINRSGYHDTQDTMVNIDLDYGSALSAIAIETVARVASERPPY